MLTRRSREVICALLLAGSVVALPSSAADDARRPSAVSNTSDTPRGWSSRNSGLDVTSGISDVVIDPANPDLMYVATQFGIFKSANAGHGWTRSSDLEQAKTIAVDPKNPSVAFAASRSSAKKTTDGGVTWTEIRPNPARAAGARALSIDPANPSTVYAVLMDGYGLSKSSDGGSTFSMINSGLIDSSYGIDMAVALAVDASVPATVYVSSSSFAVSRSTNRGESWKPAGQGPPPPMDTENTIWPVPQYFPYVNAIALGPPSSAFFYAATDLGLFRSSDGGSRWQQCQNGLPAAYVTDVVVDPTDDRNVYVSTIEHGVFKSSDRGETWTAINQRLPPRVQSLAIDSTGSFLAAATSGGVFTCSAREFVTLPSELHAEELESDPGRLKRLLEQVRALSSSHPASRDGTSSNVGLLFAVAGNAPGGLGTYFRSDVTLVNGNAAPQNVVAVWLAAGSDGTDAPSVRLTLPPSAITVANFIGKMGFSGVGSLLFIAIDSDTNVDGGANLTGFSRIWTAGPAGRGSVSQSLPATDIASLGQNRAATVIGLRMDPVFRTNVGVVNLDPRPHDFVLTAKGERTSATFTIAVGPFSMRQVSLPEGDYGELTALYETADGEFPWSAYGASVDNLTGDGWASQAVAAHPER